MGIDDGDGRILVTEGQKIQKWDVTVVVNTDSDPHLDRRRPESRVSTPEFPSFQPLIFRPVRMDLVLDDTKYN